MKIQKTILVLWMLLLGTWGIASARATDETIPDNDVVMRALVDEITRSVNLQMEDLEKPYFIQFLVGDEIMYQMAANYGALTDSDRDRSRRFYSQVRVGASELDNTNFSGGGGRGRQASLPLDDDYTAIRQAIWWATDGDYKDAVETLTKKRAYMRDKNLEDRPSDFSKASVVVETEPSAKMNFDRTAWENRVKKLSVLFNKYPQIQESGVRLFAGLGNQYVVNTEGTRLRTADTGILMVITAEMQADDGMKISDSLTYVGRIPTDVPGDEQITKDIDTMVGNMTQSAKSTVLENYTGPVLFDGLASTQLFREKLALAIAGRVEPVGTQRSSPEATGWLEKKLNQKILPDSFQVHDDPTVQKIGSDILLGHYRYDDEGVMAERVDLVVNGELKNLAISRSPTKKLSGSNGHGRKASGGGAIQCAIGNLFIEDKNGVSDDELKAKLIETAKAQGLEYGLRVSSVKTAGIASSQNDIMSIFMRAAKTGQTKLGDPIMISKVFVSDGHEEPIRGCEFGEIKMTELKNILAAGKTPTVYNYIGVGMGGATPSTSIIAPAVLLEEIELSKIEQEHDRLPILKSPLTRQ